MCRRKAFGDTTGQMLWFARILYIAFRRGTWRKVVDLKQSIYPDDRKKLVTYPVTSIIVFM